MLLPVTSAGETLWPPRLTKVSRGSFYFHGGLLFTQTAMFTA